MSSCGKATNSDMPTECVLIQTDVYNRIGVLLSRGQLGTA